MLQGPALVAGDLTEEEVLRLDRGGAFVQRVDLGITDVLLDRVVLQESGAAERLQGFRQALEILSRPVDEVVSGDLRFG